MGTKTINDVQQKAVMTPEELAMWEELPADEQLARLRAAIRLGLDSGSTDATMDQIWAKIRARHPDAVDYPSKLPPISSRSQITELQHSVWLKP
jgi:hypothetical protein